MRRTILGWLLLAVSAERLLNVYLLSRHPSIFEQVDWRAPLAVGLLAGVAGAAPLLRVRTGGRARKPPLALLTLALGIAGWMPAGAETVTLAPVKPPGPPHRAGAPAAPPQCLGRPAPAVGPVARGAGFRGGRLPDRPDLDGGVRRGRMDQAGRRRAHRRGAGGLPAGAAGLGGLGREAVGTAALHRVGPPVLPARRAA